MSAVSATYFSMAPECLGLIPVFTNNKAFAHPFGIIVAVCFLGLFLKAAKKYNPNVNVHHAAHA
jgi:hypothetical protein